MCCTGTRNPLGSLTPVAQPVSQKTSRGRGETEQRWTKQLGQRTSSSWSPNLMEPKTHGGRERGYGHEQQGERPHTTLASCACKNNEDHDRPRRAVPCKADEQATWASRADTARTGFAQIKERFCCWTRAGQGAGCGAGLHDTEPACSDAAARDMGRSCTATVNTVRERRPGDQARRIERYERQEARAKNRSNLDQNSMIRSQISHR